MLTPQLFFLLSHSSNIQFSSLAGAVYVEDCTVDRIVTDEVLHSQVVPKVTHVITTHGTIHCEYFVNASGMVSF